MDFGSAEERRVDLLKRAHLICYVCGTYDEIQQLSSQMKLGGNSFHHDYTRIHYVKKFTDRSVNVTFNPKFAESLDATIKKKDTSRCFFFSSKKTAATSTISKSKSNENNSEKVSMEGSDTNTNSSLQLSSASTRETSLNHSSNSNSPSGSVRAVNNYILALPKQDQKLDAFILADGTIENLKKSDNACALNVQIFTQLTLAKRTWYLFLQQITRLKYKFYGSSKRILNRASSSANDDQEEHMIKFDGQPCSDDFVIETENEENFFNEMSSRGSRSSGTASSSSSSSSQTGSHFASSPSMSGASKSSLASGTYIDETSGGEIRETENLLQQ